MEIEQRPHPLNPCPDETKNNFRRSGQRAKLSKRSASVPNSPRKTDKNTRTLKIARLVYGAITIFNKRRAPFPNGSRAAIYPFTHAHTRLPKTKSDVRVLAYNKTNGFTRVRMVRNLRRKADAIRKKHLRFPLIIDDTRMTRCVHETRQLCVLFMESLL